MESIAYSDVKVRENAIFLSQVVNRIIMSAMFRSIGTSFLDL